MFYTQKNLIARKYILSVEKINTEYDNMYTTAQKKIASLQRAADTTERQIFLSSV